MKTFTSLSTINKDFSRIWIIEADAKREGLYKMGQIQLITGQKPRKFSKYFGKCNQATILELSKNMIEVI